MSCISHQDGKQLARERKAVRAAVAKGTARLLLSRPKVVEVRQPASPPVKHTRGRFGEGLLRSLPSYRLPCTHEDAAWWAAECRREEDQLMDRLAAESAAMDRMEMGLEPW